jgi:hypothetical protein
MKKLPTFGTIIAGQAFGTLQPLFGWGGHAFLFGWGGHAFSSFFYAGLINPIRLI